MNRNFGFPSFDTCYRQRTLLVGVRHVLHWMLCVACSACVAGPKPPAIGSPVGLLALERGISQDQLERRLEARPRHEFTVIADARRVRCVSYFFVDVGLRYYCVFTNDVLGKVSLPPRFKHEVGAWEHGKRATWDTHDPWERVRVVMGAPALDREGLMASVDHRPQRAAFDQALPGAVAAGALFAPALLAQHLSDARGVAGGERRFNPYRASPGMTIAEVDNLFGKEALSEMDPAGVETRYYGSKLLGVRDPRLWVVVCFKAGRTIGIFSGDFFDYRKFGSER